MPEEYHDRFITCTAQAIEIRGYYIPWGTKRVPYDRIKQVKRVKMGAVTGRSRIWGTADTRYWLSFDPGRPRKAVGLILDVGGLVKPFITPDDPQAVMDAIHAHTGVAASGARGPVL